MYIYEKTEDMNYYASENPKQWGSMSDGKSEMETADVKSKYIRSKCKEKKYGNTYGTKTEAIGIKRSQRGEDRRR